MLVQKHSRPRSTQPPRAKGASATHLLAAVLGSLLALAGAARGETLAVASAPPLGAPHAVYLELLGKGGIWGLGYDYALGARFAAGATASYSLLAGQHLLSLSPYLAAYPLERGVHRWFVQAGPQLTHVAVPSPVPEWRGTSSTRVGGELSTGYERRTRLLLRVYAMAAAGAGGIAPWLGFSVGRTFR